MVGRTSGPAAEVPQGPDAEGSGGSVTDLDVVVVGGGLAGLAAALSASMDGASVVVLERHRVGGRAAVTTVEPGVVFNSGPRALYLGGAAERTLSRLGVDPVGAPPILAGALGLRGDRRSFLPVDARSLLRTRLLSSRSKLSVGRLLSRLPGIDAHELARTSVAQWIDGVGLAPDAAALVRAIIRLATYVADDELSADAAVSQLQLALGPGVLYLDGGWQQLVDALRARLAARGVQVIEHAAVSVDGPAADGGPTWRVDAGQRSIRCGSVVLACGGPSATAAMSPVALDLDGLGAPVDAACLELAVRGRPDAPVLLGVDDPLYLSVHGPPAQLAGPGISVVHVMRYGARGSDVDRADLRDHAAAVGITADRVVAERFLRRMTVSGARPLAAEGGLAGRPPVQVPATSGLFLAGDWVGAEGMLADAALASGDRAGRLAAGRAVRTASPSAPVAGT